MDKTLDENSNAYESFPDPKSPQQPNVSNLPKIDPSVVKTINEGSFEGLETYGNEKLNFL
jgi:hypothetical protein